MLELKFFALWALGLLTYIYVHKKWSAHTAFRRAMLQSNCQKPRRYPHRDPVWGYDLYRLREQASKAGYFYQLYDSHFKMHGKTFEELFWGAKVINTMERDNIQRVAVYSFQDWGKASSRDRNNAFAPVFGDGIFTQDGAAWKHSREMIKPLFTRSEIADLRPLPTYTDRLIGLLPRDGRTTDVQPLLHKFVRKFGISQIETGELLTHIPVSRRVDGFLIWTSGRCNVTRTPSRLLRVHSSLYRIYARMWAS